MPPGMKNDFISIILYKIKYQNTLGDYEWAVLIIAYLKYAAKTSNWLRFAGIQAHKSATDTPSCIFGLGASWSSQCLGTIFV